MDYNEGIYSEALPMYQNQYIYIYIRIYKEANRVEKNRDFK